jgi:hypothetical protein
MRDESELDGLGYKHAKLYPKNAAVIMTPEVVKPRFSCAIADDRIETRSDRNKEGQP